MARRKASAAADDGAASASGKKMELIIALIGLAGIIFTGLASNWDKIFHDTVSARYENYQPTDDFETEMRIFLEKSGTRTQIVETQDAMLEQARQQLLAQTGDSRQADALVKWMRDNSPSYEAVVNDFIPIWKKHLTLDQVQELNRFYSTPLMREMVAALPKVNREYLPIMMAQTQQTQRKLMDALMSGQIQ